MRMQLTLWAENLKNVGGTFRDRVSDPYAVVMINGGPLDGTKLGETEVVKNCLSPEWTKIFFVDIEGDSTYMPFKVRVYDRNDRRDDRFMTEAQFVDVVSVYRSKGSTIFVEVEGGGRIHALVTPSKQGDVVEGTFEMEMRGLDIQNIEEGVLQLGVSDPYFIIKKKFSDHSAGFVRWIPVYRSEYIEGNLNPFWNPVSIGMEEFCNCDLNCPLEIVVMDHQHRNAQDRVIASLECTPQGLMDRIAKRGNADREQALPLVQDDKVLSSIKRKNSNGQAGLLVILSAKVVE